MSGRRADGVPARRVRLRRRAAAACALLGICAALAVPPPGATEATWADPEVERGSFTAITVPAPVSTAACVADGGLLGLAPTVTISWRVPAGVTGYSLTNAEFGQATGGILLPLTSVLLGNLSTTGTPSAYKTVASGGLLGGLLGGTSTVAVRFTGPGGWKSAWLVSTASLSLAGTNPRCTLSTVPSTD